jgi:Tol biopolymer transport system component
VISLVCAALCGVSLAAEAPSRNGASGDSNIFVVNVDGTGLRNLTARSKPAPRVARALSPAGRTLAFDRLRVEGGYGWWSVNLMPARGGPVHTLIRFPDSSAYSPDWSRDGKLLAFETCCHEHAVGVVRRDGGGLTWISDASQPTWLTSTRLAFLSDVGDFAYEIAVANSDGSGRRVIASAADVFMSDVFGVSASPNGQGVVFTAEDRYSTRLYTVDVSPGRHYAMISDDGQDPSWSPTGRRLVLVTSEGPSATVDTVNPDGSGLRRFRTTRGLVPELPSWSPDGKRIAFIANRSGSNLMLMNVRRGSVRVVARGVARRTPLWSPNGRRLYYTSDPYS